MGYYSEVALAFSANGAEALRSAINDKELELALQTKNFLERVDTHNIERGSYAELFHWKSIKWSLSFKEIACIDSVLDELDNEDFLFIRIGENLEDTEIQGRYWENPFNLDVVRTVEFTLDTGTIPAVEEKSTDKIAKAI